MRRGLRVGVLACVLALGCESGGGTATPGPNANGGGDVGLASDTSAPPDDVLAVDGGTLPDTLPTPDTAEPEDSADLGDTAPLPDIPGPLPDTGSVPDVVDQDSGAADTAVTPDAGHLPDAGGDACPASAPVGVGSCSGELHCEYGTETCCGVTHPSLVCQCSGGQWGCYNTDACFIPACPGDGLLAGGWSFGECLGACKTDLSIDDQSVAVAVTGWDGTSYHTGAGSLTAAGQSAVAEVGQALAWAQLDPTYGCPDCADGGASYVTLKRMGVESTHAYEYHHAPEVLAAADALIAAVIDALLSCTGTADVAVSNGCVPYAP